MELSVSLLSLVLALVLGAVSPGPSFLMVARTALVASRKDGLAAALGMGVGGVILCAVALLGLLAVFAAIPMLYLALKVLGGAYLMYLGFRIWRGASLPLVVANAAAQNQPIRLKRHFLLGLATQLSNPKTAIVYASIFASLLPGDTPKAVLMMLPALIFVIETTWYAVVAVVLSAPVPRDRYLASKAWLDRVAGSIMALIGLKLLCESPSP